jgi:hypothetical protein
MDEEEVTTAQLAQDFPFIVVQPCNICGSVVQYTPFGINTLEAWIEIFSEYLREGITCKECENNAEKKV